MFTSRCESSDSTIKRTTSPWEVVSREPVAFVARRTTSATSSLSPSAEGFQSASGGNSGVSQRNIAPIVIFLLNDGGGERSTAELPLLACLAIWDDSSRPNERTLDPNPLDHQRVYRSKLRSRGSSHLCSILLSSRRRLPAFGEVQLHRGHNRLKPGSNRMSETTRHRKASTESSVGCLRSYMRSFPFSAERLRPSTAGMEARIQRRTLPAVGCAALCVPSMGTL
jgi:hypothetical protein